MFEDRKTATERLIALIGEPITQNTLPDFLERVYSALRDGANPNMSLPGNDKVIAGETPVEYYRRRAELFLEQAEQERMTEEGNGESVFSKNADIAKMIADVFQKAIERKETYGVEAALAASSAMRGSPEYVAMEKQRKALETKYNHKQ